MPRVSLPRAGAIALALCCAFGRAGADEPVRPGWQDDQRTFVHEDGRVQTLIQPEFRAASAIARDLDVLKLPDVTVQLVAPFAAVPPPDFDKPPGPAEAYRLLLSGSREAVALAATHVDRLDVPKRQVSVSMLIAEVSCHCVRGSGATWRIDKGPVESSADALFRGFESRFDPESYLASELTGARPFEGTSLDFGHMKFLGAAWDVTLRMMMKHGRAEMFAWPTLVCSENEPARLRSLETMMVPFPNQTVKIGEAELHSTVARAHVTGLRLEVTALRVGTEDVVLEIDLWLRVPEALEQPGTRPMTVGLNTRQVTTRVTVRDQEPLLIGGLYLRRFARLAKGIPIIERITLLDAVTGAHDKQVIDTELIFLIQADVHSPLSVAPIAPDAPFPDPLRDGLTRIPNQKSIDTWRGPNETGPARERAGPEGSLEK